MIIKTLSNTGGSMTLKNGSDNNSNNNGEGKEDRIEELIENFQENIDKKDDRAPENYFYSVEYEREELFKVFYRLVKRGLPEKREKYKTMLENIVGARPSNILDIDDYETVIISDEIEDELIYLLAAEQLLYEDE